MDRHEDREEIRHIFLETLPGMVRAGDAPGYAGLFTDAGIWCPPNAVDRRGRFEIESAVAELFASQWIDPEFHVDEIKISGELGLVIGWGKELIQPKDGSAPSVAYSREVWSFHKTHDSWRIASIIWNLKPGPPASSLQPTHSAKECA